MVDIPESPETWDAWALKARLEHREETGQKAPLVLRAHWERKERLVKMDLLERRA